MTGKASITKFIVALLLGAIALGAPFAKATQAKQGSRKDDVVFNAQGLPMAGAMVRVCTASSTGEPCSPLAAIYSDNALTMPAANPLTTDGLGNYSFYAAPGRYTVEISGPGITTYQMPNVILPSDPSSPTFTTVTTTSGINAFSLSLSGNLTVTGSAAVTGSLSVGGAPVPSTGVDNQWSASQRFKGPVPYRDISAYMPAGGCADDINSNTAPYHFAISINAASYSGTITASYGTAKMGCGISIFGAGPTSTLVMPSGGTATASGSAGTVTYTLSTAHNLPLTGSLTNDNPVIVTGCANSAFDTNGTEISSVPTATTITVSLGATGATTGCTVSFLMAYAHGTTGSTDYWYEVAAIDNLDGTSPAVGPVEVTDGNATLGRASDGIFNYNWIGWPYTANARMFAVYRSTNGTSYSLVGCATTNGWSDWGYSAPCPQFVPSTPPSANTAESLKTTIAAVSGSSITLNAMASTSVTSAISYHDETTFLLQCLTDLNTNQADPSTQNGTEAYCYVPPTAAGYAYYFNSDMPWDTYQLNAGAHIEIAGTMYSNTWPWIFSKGGYYIHGMANTMNDINFGVFPATAVYFGKYVPAAYVFHANAPSGISHLGVSGLYGFGLEMNPDPSNGASGGACFDNLYIGINLSSGTGVPLVFDSNTLGVTGCNAQYADNLNLYPRPDGFPAAILETNTTYSGNGQCCIQLGYTQFLWHHIYIESAGGQGNGQGSEINVNLGLSEEDGQYATTGVVHYDSGNNDGSANCSGGPCTLPYGTDATRLAGASITMTDADASSKVNATISGQNTIPSWNVNVGGDLYLQGPVCMHGSTLCQGAVGVNGVPGTQRNYLTGPYQDVALAGGTTTLLYSGYNVGVENGNFIQYLAAPTMLQVVTCATSGGSLADGSYYFKIIEEDNGGTAGTTLPSPEAGCTISGGGGHGAIYLQWQDAQYLAEKDSRVYVATQPCDIYNCYEGSYTIVPIQTSLNQTYEVTTISGWTSDALSNHYSPSALMWTESCIWCRVLSSNILNGGFQFAGPGENSIPSTSTVAFKGELSLDSDSSLKAAIRGTEATPGTTCAAGIDYLWPDVTDHRWKACNNNGTASDVLLKGDFSAGTFSTLPSCASGTEGTMRGVTDSTTNTWGATISGSGSDHVLAYCDGTSWTVAGK